MAHGVTLQIFRTSTPNNPPPANSLAQGELAVEMASTPPNLWCGVPTSIAASGQILLNGATASGVTSWNTRTGAVTLTAADVTGVGGALLASPTFTGTPAAPTATAGTSTTQIATTAFVTTAIAAIPTGGVTSFNTRTGAVTLQAADVTGVGGALLASPTFTGVPAAPTASPGTSTTQLATTAFVAAAVSAGTAGVSSITGTANQIAASASTGAVTLSLVGPYTPATFSAHGLLVGEGTSSIASVAPASAGRVLASNGLSVDPSWSATPTLGVPGSTNGTLTLANSVGSGTVTFASPASLGTSYTITWPAAVPGNYQVPFFTSPGIMGLTGSPSDSGQVLQWNGSQPRWTSQPGLGNSGSSAGTLSLTGGLGGNGTVTLASQTAAYTNYTFQFPAGAPSNGSLLVFSGGTGVTNGLADAAAGQVLTSQGTTAVPAWSASPALTGVTLSTPLSIASGGTGSATAPTAGQVSIAQSASAYGPVTMSGDATITSAGAVTVSGIRSTAVPTLASGYLYYNGSAFVWQTPSGGGTVTSITAGTGLTGGTITNTGTIALSVPVSIANGGTNATTAPAALTSLGAAPIANPNFTGTVSVGGVALGSLYAPLTNPTSGQNNYAPLASPTFTGTATFPDGSYIVTAGANNGLAGNVYGFQNSTGLGIGFARTSGAPPVGGNTLILGQINTPCVLFQTSGYVPTASIVYNPTTTGYFDIGLSCYYNGSNWIAGAAGTGMIGWMPGASPELDIYINTGTTAGNSFTVNQMMRIGAGFMAINGSIQSSLAGSTQIYLGGTNAAGAAGTISSVVANNINIASGTYSLSGTGWIANASNPLIFAFNAGQFQWYQDTGKTVGAGYSPTQIAYLDSGGGAGFVCPTAMRTQGGFFLQGGSIPAGTYWSFGAGGQTNSSTMVVNNTGIWYMRDGNPDWLSWNPTGPAGGNGAYVNISDIRFKSNVTPEERGLEVIRQLRPIIFQRSNPDGALRPSEVGFSAQDVKPILPEAVTVIGSLLPDGSGGIDSDDPTLAITYDSIVTVLVNAVKQLDARLAAVEAQ